ncbi:MAG: hypothetical protein ACLFST_07065 [Spirochaetia bacterium]
MEPYKKIYGKPSWVLSTDTMELAVTQRGGHMAPVTFYKQTSNPVQPYYISPWQEEDFSPEEPVLVPLRGDFFCMPFGESNLMGDEDHPVHGEPAGSTWEFLDHNVSPEGVELVLGMKTLVRPGNITKRIRLKNGENTVYIRHDLEGFDWLTSMGHHATLKAVDDREMLISTSPIKFGMVAPSNSEYQKGREYHSLKGGARFTDLRKVPTQWHDEPVTDCTKFPSREGFTDILAVFSREDQDPAWTCVSVPRGGYLWFSLKDPLVLPSTVFWMSNKGRHTEPWNGRNQCIGLEDTCGFFASGLAESARENLLNSQGITTAVQLEADKVTSVRYIEGVVQIGPGFGRVQDVKFGAESAEFRSETGERVTAPVDFSFLEGGI